MTDESTETPTLLEIEQERYWDRKVDNSEDNIADAAQRAHALLLVSAGTKDCPSIEMVIDAIRFCLAAAADNPEQEYFAAHGIWVRMERSQPMWDIFEVLVPATSTKILFREWYDSEHNAYRVSDSGDDGD